MRGTLNRHQDSLGKIPKISEKKKKIQEHAVWDDDDWGGGFLPLRIDAAHTANANDWITDHSPPPYLYTFTTTSYYYLLPTTHHPLRLYLPPFKGREGQRANQSAHIRVNQHSTEFFLEDW